MHNEVLLNTIQYMHFLVIQQSPLNSPCQAFCLCIVFFEHDDGHLKKQQQKRHPSCRTTFVIETSDAHH